MKVARVERRLQRDFAELTKKGQKISFSQKRGSLVMWLCGDDSDTYGGWDDGGDDGGDGDGDGEGVGDGGEDDGQWCSLYWAAEGDFECKVQVRIPTDHLSKLHMDGPWRWPYVAQRSVTSRLSRWSVISENVTHHMGAGVK